MTALHFKHSDTTSQAYEKNVHNDRCYISSIYSIYREQNDPRRSVDQRLQDLAVAKSQTTGEQAIIKAYKQMVCFLFNLLYLGSCHKNTLVSVLCYSCC